MAYWVLFKRGPPSSRSPIRGTSSPHPLCHVHSGVSYPCPCTWEMHSPPFLKSPLPKATGHFAALSYSQSWWDILWAGSVIQCGHSLPLSLCIRKGGGDLSSYRVEEALPSAVMVPSMRVLLMRLKDSRSRDPSHFLSRSRHPSASRYLRVLLPTAMVNDPTSWLQDVLELAVLRLSRCNTGI